MSRMRRINDKETHRTYKNGESDTYRKFKEQFEKMFDAGEIAKNDEEFEKLYVPDESFEKQCQEFKNAKQDRIVFCVGYTGIGKTTGLRHCFKLGIYDGAHFMPEEHMIVFPTFLDGYQASDIKEGFNLAPRISAVNTGLIEKYPELKQILRTSEGRKEFYEFIRKHTAFALENVGVLDVMDLDDEELIKRRLNNASRKNPIEFQANLLKYYIMKKYDTYSQLIIILDDIESLPEDYQKNTIATYLKFHKCMQNTEYPENGEYHVKLLISVRPHTHRLVRRSRQAETFPISEPEILKERAVDLSELFKSRFEYYVTKSNRVVKNEESWRECMRNLEYMNNAFEGKYKEMISNLCFENIREALAEYARIFANRFWVQKNKPKGDFFTVNPADYCFNNINVIRAISCREEYMFWGDDLNAPVPNIFYTTEDEDLSVYCLAVMKYFERKRNNEVYGLNAEPLSVVKSEWKNIFGDELSTKFIRSMEYLFERKILRKSIHDVDDIRTLDMRESLSDISRLYISPKGTELFCMFERDSVLLELLREAAWRDYDGWNYSDKSSSELMRMGRQKDIFVDLLEYIEYLSETERDLLAASRLLGKRRDYATIFGNVPVTASLLQGVRNSLTYSGIMEDEQIKSQYENVEEIIRNIM